MQANSVYNVDFYMLGHTGRYVFNCLSFEYLDESRRYVIMVSENISHIVTGETDPLTGGLNAEGFCN
ncbi:MAG: hypothetical protein PUJ49_01220 [bacterium]|nr:hypothetical protein [bacterium]